MPTLTLPAKLLAAAVVAAAMAPTAADGLDGAAKAPVMLASLGTQPTARVAAAGADFTAARSRYALANALGFGSGELPETVIAEGIGKEGLYGRMDDGDVAMAAATLHTALERAPAGISVDWQSGLSGHGGSITPLSAPYRDGQHRVCRDYAERLVIGGRARNYTHRGCRDRSGVWVWVE